LCTMAHCPCCAALPLWPPQLWLPASRALSAHKACTCAQEAAAMPMQRAQARPVPGILVTDEIKQERAAADAAPRAKRNVLKAWDAWEAGDKTLKYQPLRFSGLKDTRFVYKVRTGTRVGCLEGAWPHWR